MQQHYKNDDHTNQELKAANSSQTQSCQKKSNAADEPVALTLQETTRPAKLCLYGHLFI